MNLSSYSSTPSPKKCLKLLKPIKLRTIPMLEGDTQLSQRLIHTNPIKRHKQVEYLKQIASETRGMSLYQVYKMNQKRSNPKNKTLDSPTDQNFMLLSSSAFRDRNNITLSPLSINPGKCTHTAPLHITPAGGFYVDPQCSIVSDKVINPEQNDSMVSPKQPLKQQIAEAKAKEPFAVKRRRVVACRRTERNSRERKQSMNLMETVRQIQGKESVD